MLDTCDVDISRVQQLYQELWHAYGPQGWWPLLYTENTPGYHHASYLEPQTPEGQFEVCVGAILTQNTNWTNVIKALDNLYVANLLKDTHILDIPESDLMQLIRPSGYFRQKTKKLKIFTQWWINRGKNAKHTPCRTELLSLWGIGPETADSILCYAYHEPIFVADTYSKRLFIKKGILAKEKANYENIQNLGQQIQPLAGQSDVQAYKEFHALIVHHNKEKNCSNPF